MAQPVPLSLKAFPPDPVHTGRKDEDTSVVIDFGSCKTAAGWSDEPKPFLNFKSLVAKGKSGGRMRNVVGNDLDHVTVSNITSPFVSDVPFHFGNVEAVLDHVFGHLGVLCRHNAYAALLLCSLLSLAFISPRSRIKTYPIPHSVLLTEPVSCPVHTRQLMSELMFECYSVPRVGFGVDALFSYMHHKRSDLASLGTESALVLRSGFNASHILPILNGKCSHKDILRVDVGGNTSTAYLQQILQLSNPTIKISYQLADHIKENFCYVSSDYLNEMRAWRIQARKLDETPEIVVTPKIVQLPYTSTSVKPTAGAKDEKDADQKRQERSDRMRQMAQEKREKKVETMKEQRDYIQNLFNLKISNHEEYQKIMDAEGYIEEDLLDHLNKLERSLNNQPQPKKEQDFSLIDVDDDLLDEAQKKEKKKQQFVKTMADSRKAQQQKREEKAAKQQEQDMKIIQQVEADPQAWYKDITSQIQELKQAIAKKQQQSQSRLTGRQTVKSLARMRALTRVEDEDFGTKDEDWEKYLEIDKTVDTLRGEEEAQLERLEALFAKFWPPKNWVGATPEDLSESDYPMEAMAAQIQLGACMPRATEVLFQPSLVGIEQMGLMEAADYFLRNKDYDISEVVKRVYITGGNMATAGMRERILSEVILTRPMGELIEVTVAEDPVLDAWKGAMFFASKCRSQFLKTSITREAYDECGAVVFKAPHFASNWS